MAYDAAAGSRLDEPATTSRGAGGMTTAGEASLGKADGGVTLTPGGGVSEPASTTARRPSGARHHWIVRVTHWVNVIALGLMVTTGLRIFDAYPAFARRG